MEQFEIIRKEHFLHEKSIREIAREQGVHRRVVRQALGEARPPERKSVERAPTVLTMALRSVAEGWLRADVEAPRKQRHTARRIYQRLVAEYGYEGVESSVRQFVGRRRRELGLKLQATIPRDHLAGEEGEVDWYEAEVDFPWGRERAQFFQMRACFSGREYHKAFPRQTQQAFLEGHVGAFAYFGGVFHLLRFDNLSSAVRKVLRGRRRLETDRFVCLRSHYLFESEFCRAGIDGAHEKGGVEGGVGRFRRTHLVPVPCFESYGALNDWLLERSRIDDARRMEGHSRRIEEDWEEEQPKLLPLPKEPMSTVEVERPKVDSKGRIRLRTNAYSVPIGLVGRRVESRISALRVEVVHGGRVVAVHDRWQGNHGERLVLDHYLELLSLKPGALKRARPLRQAREAGVWPETYDRLWASLNVRLGESEGTRQMIDVLLLHREGPVEDVHTAVGLALEYGCCDAGAVRVLLRQLCTATNIPERLQGLGALSVYDRPVGDLSAYNGLLANPVSVGEVN